MQNITHQSGCPDNQNHSRTLEVQRNEIFKQALFSTIFLNIRSLFWQFRKENKEKLVTCMFTFQTACRDSCDDKFVLLKWQEWFMSLKSYFLKFFFNFNFRFWTSLLCLCLCVNIKHTEKQFSIAVKTLNSGHLPQVT